MGERVMESGKGIDLGTGSNDEADERRGCSVAGCPICMWTWFGLTLTYLGVPPCCQTAHSLLPNSDRPTKAELDRQWKTQITQVNPT